MGRRVHAPGRLVWDVELPIGYPSDPQQIGPDAYLVADYEDPGAIVVFNRQGTILYRYQPASGTGELNRPSLVELLPSGVFMLNDDYNDRLVAIDPATGALVWQYGVTGEPGAAAGSARRARRLRRPRTGRLDPDPHGHGLSAGGGPDQRSCGRKDRSPHWLRWRFPLCNGPRARPRPAVRGLAADRSQGSSQCPFDGTVAAVLLVLLAAEGRNRACASGRSSALTCSSACSWSPRAPQDREPPATGSSAITPAPPPTGERPATLAAACARPARRGTDDLPFRQRHRLVVRWARAAP